MENFDSTYTFDEAGLTFDGSGLSVVNPLAKSMKVLLYDQYFNLKKVLTNYSELYWEYNRIGGCGQCSFALLQDIDNHETLFAPQTSARVYINGQLRYQGVIRKYVRKMQSGGELVVPVFFGYLSELDDIIVRRTYENTEVSEILRDILDEDIVPNTNVGYTANDIDQTDYVVESVEFNHTAKDAIVLLGQLAGNYEWGVDRNRNLYFRNPSRTVARAYILGREVTVYEEERSNEAVTNIVNVFGRNGYITTVQSSLSVNIFGRNEKNLFESSISENSDAVRIASVQIKNLGKTQRTLRFGYMKEDEFIELSHPLGATAINNSSIRRLKKYSTFKYGTSNKYGNLTPDQIHNIRYTPVGGGLDVQMSLLEDLPSLGNLQKRQEYEIRDLQRR